MMKKIDKKAFTLIELIVVIAVLGILVLLGAPRFIGYTQRAELARIQHDTKVMEQEVGTVLINEDDDFNEWGNNSKDFNQLIQENKLFEKEGPVNSVEDLSADNDYKVIPEEFSKEINTKLKGTFYANSGGEVYYEHENPLVAKQTGAEKPTGSGEPDEDGPRKPIEGEIAIDSAEELAKIGEEYPLEGKYILTANIDLSHIDNWAPIGSYISSTNNNPFTGSFDGNGYKITRLTINRSTTNPVGLFGYTHGAIINNVTLEDINVTGGHYVGGLVGRADGGTIENFYATGTVTGSGWYVGGLAGRADKLTITNSYSTGSVKTKSFSTNDGPYSNAGGLVGYAGSNTTITNSYSTGSVEGTGKYVGGLAGYASGTVTISNSYATGSVKGSSIYGNAGGLVGWAHNLITITNSYWDKETTGRSTSSEQPRSFGKTTDEMKQQTTYEGWDFDTVWKIDEGNDYPKLR